MREKESYMVEVGKQDTFKKYYQLNDMKNEITPLSKESLHRDYFE